MYAFWIYTWCVNAITIDLQEIDISPVYQIRKLTVELPNNSSSPLQTDELHGEGQESDESAAGQGEIIKFKVLLLVKNGDVLQTERFAKICKKKKKNTHHTVILYFLDDQIWIRSFLQQEVTGSVTTIGTT